MNKHQTVFDQIAYVVDTRTAERFMKSFSIDENGCWVWLMQVRPDGYGCFSVKQNDKWKTVRAHRWVFQTLNPNTDLSLSICHKCDNPSCVNPLHLFAGTRSDNMQDALRKGRFYLGGNPKKTICKHGHPMSGENLRTEQRKDGRLRRVCIQCYDRRKKTRTAVRKAARIQLRDKQGALT